MQKHQKKSSSTRERERERVPDFLDEDGTELASEVLGADAVLEVLAGEDALLRVLDVASGLACDESLDAARDHLPSHDCEGLLQITVPDPNPNPSTPLNLMMLMHDAAVAPSNAGAGGRVPSKEGRRPLP